MKSHIVSERAFRVDYRSREDKPSGSARSVREATRRLNRGTALMVVVVSSLGLWWSIGWRSPL